MILRRLRAIAITALLWSVASAFTSILYLIALSLLRGSKVFAVLFPDYFLVGAITWGIWGAVNGVAFATLLASAEHDRTLEDLSRRRVALWGAVGGALMPILTYGLSLLVPGLTLAGGSLEFAPGTILPIVLISTTLGAGLATGQLSLARRLPPPQTPHALSAPRAT